MGDSSARALPGLDGRGGAVHGVAAALSPADVFWVKPCGVQLQGLGTRGLLPPELAKRKRGPGEVATGPLPGKK